MRMSASTVETPSVDRKSHMILLRHELPLSWQGVWTGITRQKFNFDDQQKIEEMFPHLKSTKFSRHGFSQNRRQNFRKN